jgi:tetratricopeptide (TPR) repeat protein
LCGRGPCVSKCREPTTPKRDVKGPRTILLVAAAQTTLTAFSDEIHYLFPAKFIADRTAEEGAGEAFQHSSGCLKARFSLRRRPIGTREPGFAEAWYNLSDLLDDQGHTDKAVACLQRALDVNPNHANMALLLKRLEKHKEAAGYWRRYLALDDSGRLLRGNSQIISDR